MWSWPPWNIPKFILVFDPNTRYGGVRGNYYPPPTPTPNPQPQLFFSWIYLNCIRTRILPGISLQKVSSYSSKVWFVEGPITHNTLYCFGKTHTPIGCICNWKVLNWSWFGWAEVSELPPANEAPSPDNTRIMGRYNCGWNFSLRQITSNIIVDTVDPLVFEPYHWWKNIWWKASCRSFLKQGHCFKMKGAASIGNPFVLFCVVDWYFYTFVN